MPQPDANQQRIEKLVIHRRRVAELKSALLQIRTARTTALLLVLVVLVMDISLATITVITAGQVNMLELNLLVLGLTASAVVGAGQIYNTWGRTAKVAKKREDTGDPTITLVDRKFVDLRLDLELEEESQLLAAAYVIPPAYERQHSYRSRIPAEIGRLRVGSRRYQRWHNCLQWLLILCSAAIPAVTALYEAPQPGKGILISLGATVTMITSLMGYYKFRERGFNLQQTADSIEQHLTALDIVIAPYNNSDEKQNMERFAETVESLRDEQRKREQQLDQPHTGQQSS